MVHRSHAEPGCLAANWIRFNTVLQTCTSEFAESYRPAMGAKDVRKTQPITKGAKTLKKTSKQPLPTSEKLKRLFNSLCAQVDGGHFSNAVKTCDKILHLVPGDTDALQTKLFLLLQTERYKDALALIDGDANYVFEKAYSLYRLHKEDEVTEVLGSLKKVKGEDDRGVTHLEAQLNYRQGSYQKAFDLYNELLDTTEPDTEEHSDILTNLEAAQKHLDFINQDYLRSLDVLPASLTSTIESAPPPPPPQPSSALQAASSSAPFDEQKRPVAPKKVRVKRVPAGVVPGVTPPPDPERWLKKSERSTFHAGGGHKKRKGGGGATQGVVESVHPSSSGGSTPGGKGKGKKKK
ncbi:hypothetical protein QCA50_004923 [Cerrena zonata]|uniref:Signal recognition particle subunit SRP72 n=1 Tax=Cerrena zonata TaxID=2478898 RepID=A0AAW0GPL7_9APHY